MNSSQKFWYWWPRIALMSIIVRNGNGIDAIGIALISLVFVLVHNWIMSELR